MQHEALSLQAHANIQSIMNADGIAHRNPQNMSLGRRIGTGLAHRVIVEIVGSHEQRHARSQSRQRQREIGWPLVFRHTPSKAAILCVFCVCGERSLVEKQLLSELKRFDTLSVIGTILERVFDRILGVFSAFLQVGFVLDEFIPVVINIISNGEGRSGFEGRECFDGKNVFVLATIAKILGVEILGRSECENREQQIPQNLENTNIARKAAIDSIHSLFLLPLDNFQLAADHVSCCVNTLVRSSCAIPSILRTINSTRFLQYFHKSIFCIKVRICDYAGFMQSLD